MGVPSSKVCACACACACMCVSAGMSVCVLYTVAKVMLSSTRLNSAALRECIEYGISQATVQ